MKTFKLPPVIQAMANSLKNQGHTSAYVARKVAKYLELYHKGETEHERKVARQNVRRLLRSVKPIHVEESRLFRAA